MDPCFEDQLLPLAHHLHSGCSRSFGSGNNLPHFCLLLWSGIEGVHSSIQSGSRGHTYVGWYVSCSWFHLRYCNLYQGEHHIRGMRQRFFYLRTALVILAYLIQIFFFSYYGGELTFNVRSRVFRSILRQEIGWFDDKENSTGSIMSRLSNDAGQVEGVIAFSSRQMLCCVYLSLLNLTGCR